MAIRHAATATLGLTLLLAGCAGAPSESDVHEAVEDSIGTLNEQIMAMGGPMASQIGSYELTAFELLGCEAAGEAYSCDVVLSMDTPLMAVNDRATTLRLREGSDGWIVVGGLQ